MLVNGTHKSYSDSTHMLKKFKQPINIGCYCEKYVNTSKPLHHIEKTSTFCHLHDPEKIAQRTKNRNKINNRYSSFSRSKSKVLDYALSNNFNYFLNLTFDPNATDSLDHSATKKKMTNWLRSMRYNFPDMKYILVPELHKSGRLHFHGLFFLSNPPLTPARNKKTNRLLFDQKKRQIYNLPSYSLGFSQVTSIDSTTYASYYITKYITKDLATALPDQKRYWLSKNLTKPTISHSIFLPKITDLNITSDYSTDFYTKYNYKTLKPQKSI